jgi:hypothetical protein
VSGLLSAPTVIALAEAQAARARALVVSVSSLVVPSLLGALISSPAARGCWAHCEHGSPFCSPASSVPDRHLLHRHCGCWFCSYDRRGGVLHSHYLRPAAPRLRCPFYLGRPSSLRPSCSLPRHLFSHRDCFLCPRIERGWRRSRWASSVEGVSSARVCTSSYLCRCALAILAQPASDMVWGVGSGHHGTCIQHHGGDTTCSHLVDCRLGCLKPHHP